VRGDLSVEDIKLGHLRLKIFITSLKTRGKNLSKSYLKLTILLFIFLATTESSFAQENRGGRVNEQETDTLQNAVWLWGDLKNGKPRK